MNWIRYSPLILAGLFILSGQVLSGQEVLTQAFIRKSQEVPLLKSRHAVGSDTLSLPFIDDFARGVGDPATTNWVDHDAFVNYQYPHDPPSIGVATLDAIDASGGLPSNANTTGYRSDELTSRALNLDVQAGDSLYMSFYYQTGGRGDASGGEYQDSLILQFWDVQAQKWSSVWSAAYSRNDTTMYERRPLEGTEHRYYAGEDAHLRFFHAMVPIRRSRFLQPGFRFRFVNYASVSEEKPSTRGNVDQWHLDFVYLDSSRTRQDTVINDIAFVEPLKPLLNNYESVPWSHFPDASVFEMRDSLSITYSNLSDQSWNTTQRFEIIDRMGDNEPFTFTGGTVIGIPPHTTESYPTSINYTFPYEENRDSALFEIRSYMITDTIRERAPYRWNDTIRYMQKFYNYYAYDDGTAENGYGFHGQGSQNVLVALRYTTYTPDTLQAVQIYFNQTLDSASQNSFALKIWADNGGRPGRLLYEQTGERPVYEDSLNAFHTYVLEEKIFLEGTFYVGYQKFNSEMLNVGFDVNRIHNDRLFYNLGGQWNPSQMEGTLMIRPVFGEYIEPVLTSTPPGRREPEQPDVELHPNPVKDWLHIDLKNGRYHDYALAIYDMQGRMIRRDQRMDRSMQLQGLSPGVYIVHIRHRNRQAVLTRKIIITP